MNTCRGTVADHEDLTATRDTTYIGVAVAVAVPLGVPEVAVFLENATLSTGRSPISLLRTGIPRMPAESR
jgi:hypothetical protein